MGNSIDMEPGRTHDRASKKNQDMESRQSFPMGSVDSAVGENSQSRKTWPLALVQYVWSYGLQLFDEQPFVRQPQPGEQFQVEIL